MPNGRPGDHPFTDIVTHNMDVFGQEIDTLVRKIVTMPGYNGDIDRELGEILWNNDPRWQNEECDYVFVKSSIEKLIDSITK